MSNANRIIIIAVKMEDNQIDSTLAIADTSTFGNNLILDNATTYEDKKRQSIYSSCRQ